MMQEMLPPNRYKQGSKFRPLFYTDLGLAFNASLSVVERFVDEFYGRNGLGHTLIFVEVSMLALRVNKKSGFHRFNQGYLCFFFGCVCCVLFESKEGMAVGRHPCEPQGNRRTRCPAYSALYPTHWVRCDRCIFSLSRNAL